MRFVDEATITVRSGRGGDGIVSFRREKFVPRGGPDGGDGGRGGDVIVRADPRLRSLLDYRYRRFYRAEDGGRGGPNRRTGRNGRDKVLLVPPGTLVLREDGEVLADLAHPGDEVVVCRGGRGGRGNAHFATPWRQAPDFGTPGGEGEEAVIRLELRLLADIGIVGLPNAGKSSLINRISAAKARVADYPFTTLEPNLGVVEVGPGATFVVADMPGLVAGASRGVGLGTRFLRHCERAKALVYLVDASVEPEEAVQALRTVESELRAHSEEIASRPSLVAANKCDLPGCEPACDALRAEAARRGRAFFTVSALTGAGVRDLVRAMARLALGEPAGPRVDEEPFVARALGQEETRDKGPGKV